MRPLPELRALRITALLVGLLSATPIAAAQPSPNSLARPTGCVLDRAGALRPSTVRGIQAECDRVRAQGHELAVVVMRTAGSRGSAQYALDLFNAWGLGGPGDNDGVLLYAAIEDRAAEITLGDDLDTPANTARSDRVMMDIIVPAFRRGSPDQAMLQGARYAAANLFRAGSGSFVRPTDPGSSSATSSPGTSSPSTRSFPQSPQPSSAHYGDDDAADDADDYDYDYDDDYQSPGFFEQIDQSLDGYGGKLALGALGFLLLILLRLVLRYRPRKCEKCGSPMIRLGEKEDDKLLNRAQRKEEEIGSVDYDVWACASCDHAIERRYAAIFTRYRTCSSCQARTESSVTRTIQAATYSSSGLAQVTVSCKNCGKSHSYTRTIPRKTRSRSSGGGGRSGGGGGFSGGGRSSGGGSSGRW